MCSSLVVDNYTAKAARRMRGYLIRLTREYTDGGANICAENDIDTLDNSE